MIVSSLRCTGTWVGFRSLCVGVNVASDGTACWQWWQRGCWTLQGAGRTSSSAAGFILGRAIPAGSWKVRRVWACGWLWLCVFMGGVGVLWGGGAHCFCELFITFTLYARFAMIQTSSGWKFTSLHESYLLKSWNICYSFFIFFFLWQLLSLANWLSRVLNLMSWKS